MPVHIQELDVLHLPPAASSGPSAAPVAAGAERDALLQLHRLAQQQALLLAQAQRLQAD